MYKRTCDHFNCLNDEHTKSFITQFMKKKKTKEDFVRVTYLKDNFAFILDLLTKNNIPFKLQRLVFRSELQEDQFGFVCMMSNGINFTEDEVNLLLHDDRFYLILKLSDFITLQRLNENINIESDKPFHINSPVQFYLFRV